MSWTIESLLNLRRSYMDTLPELRRIGVDLRMSVKSATPCRQPILDGYLLATGLMSFHDSRRTTFMIALQRTIVQDDLRCLISPIQIQTLHDVCLVYADRYTAYMQVQQALLVPLARPAGLSCPALVALLGPLLHPLDALIQAAQDRVDAEAVLLHRQFDLAVIKLRRKAGAAAA